MAACFGSRTVADLSLSYRSWPFPGDIQVRRVGRACSADGYRAVRGEVRQLRGLRGCADLRACWRRSARARNCWMSGWSPRPGKLRPHDGLCDPAVPVRMLATSGLCGAAEAADSCRWRGQPRLTPSDSKHAKGESDPKTALPVRLERRRPAPVDPAAAPARPVSPPCLAPPDPSGPGPDVHVHRQRIPSESNLHQPRAFLRDRLLTPSATPPESTVKGKGLNVFERLRRVPEGEKI
jgi:hypothetical protein